jgi:DNA-binding response OmpR family regulator
VVLSATNAIHKKTEMLDAGADDYVIKPCHAAELLARVKAVSRRSNHKTSTNITIVGEISLDLNKKEVRIKNQIFNTTSSQYKIIELMVRNKGNIVSKENLIGYLYNPDEKVPHKKILDVFFCQLRKRIAEIVGKDKLYIKTCWGIGYKLMNIPPVYYPEDNEEEPITSVENRENFHIENTNTNHNNSASKCVMDFSNYNVFNHG